MTIAYLAVLTAMLTTATPLILAALGEVITERAGVLNLGIEGTMYSGAFAGFVGAELFQSAWWGLVVAIVVGVAVGLLMGLLSVTLGVSQHVAGVGITLLAIASCDFASRLKYGGARLPQIPKFNQLFPDTPVASQYLLTYITILVIAPAVWYTLRSTGMGLKLRAVGENPEAADAAGISVARTRYAALAVGGALMAVGGAFLSLAMLGSFTINIVNGRGWVAIALVIFARWRVWPAVFGGLLFAIVDALQLQLVILPEFAAVPREVMIALPYLVVIVALALSGRNVRYPGAYLQPYRRT